MNSIDLELISKNSKSPSNEAHRPSPRVSLKPAASRQGGLQKGHEEHFFSFTGGVTLRRPAQAISHLRLSGPEPHHLRRAPRRWLRFALGSVCRYLELRGATGGQIKINRGALKVAGVVAAVVVVVGVLLGDLTRWLTLRRKCEKFTVV